MAQCPTLPPSPTAGHRNYSTTPLLSQEGAGYVPTPGPQGMTETEGLEPQLPQRTVQMTEGKEMRLGSELKGPQRQGLLLKGSQWEAF